MFIKKIKIKNFKSFYNEHEFIFENLYGLWKISGDVGAGKTTISEIIIFALFGSVKGKSNTDLISWGENKSLIEIWCNCYDNNIYIKRENNRYGQSPIYIEINNKPLIFTNKKNAQQQLETDYFDISKITIELLCIISFNNFKSLSTLNTSDLKIFLDKMLGFTILNDYNNICIEYKNINNNNIKELQCKIENYQAQINKLNELSNLSKSNSNEILMRLNKLKEILNDLKHEYSNKYNKLINESKKISSQLQSTITIGKKLKQEYDIIKNKKCPICGSVINDDIINGKLNEILYFRETYKNLKDKNDLYKSELDNFIKINTKNINDYNNQISETNKLLIQAKEKEKYININLEEINILKQKINDIESEILKLKENDIEWSELSNIFSYKIKNKIISAFIPALNKNIEKYIKDLNQPYIIKFNEDFKCNISLYGITNNISINSLSTGQLKIVDMIIILGILNTVINSTNINIFFLDELFSNLDTHLKYDMCKILKKNCKKNQVIFLISHTEIDDDLFDGEILLKLININFLKNCSQINIKFYKNF